MRTALVLLLLLALAAIPGSVIPQSGVDSLKTSRWQADHPDLTPIYERLGLFSVYDSAWFAAIYMLLMVSLVGCIIPRLFVYWRALRARAAGRAAAPLPAAGAHVVRRRRPPGDVLADARTVLKDRGYRVHRGRRLGRGRARLPPRGGQPAVPPGRRGRAGGLRGRRAVRLQGRRDPRGRQRLLQQPHAVRRLRPGLAVRPRLDGAVQLQRRRLRRRVDRLGAAAGDGRRASTRTSPTARRRATSRSSTT